MAKILLIDANKLARQYVELCVQNTDAYTVLASIEYADTAEVYCRSKPVDIVIMGISLYDSLKTIASAVSLKKINSNLKIVVMSSTTDRLLIEKAKELGVDSMFYKEESNLNLFSILDITIKGGHYWPDMNSPVYIGNVKCSEFTDRELDVLRKLAAGYSDNDIAELLNISYHTARTHVKKMLQKTGCTSRTQLAVLAVTSGAVMPNI